MLRDICSLPTSKTKNWPHCRRQLVWPPVLGTNKGPYIVTVSYTHLDVYKRQENKVGIGAHPGFPDLQGFGRRQMKFTRQEVQNLIIYQVGALAAFARAAGQPLQHVKAHGALYNMAAKDPALAEAIAAGIKAAAPEAILLGLAASEMIAAAKKAGLKVAQEVFADRGYNPDGTLVPRSQPGADVYKRQGFSYLGGMDERLATPRLKTPRTHIPAGSTGIAGKQTGIYPIDSPGGWQLIGRTPLKLYDPFRDPPVLLKAGNYVRFVAVSQDEYEEIAHQVKAGSYQIRQKPLSAGREAK